LLALLILVTIGDLLMAVLLVAVSGFIFGPHEGMGGEPATVALWSAAILACLAAPIAGFVLRAYRKPGIGASIAAAPLIVGLFLAFSP
jgi:hypothetical protein